MKVKAIGYNAHVYEYSDTQKEVHVQTPSGFTIRIMIPDDPEKFGMYEADLPYGLNLVTYGHYR